MPTNVEESPKEKEKILHAGRQGEPEDTHGIRDRVETDLRLHLYISISIILFFTLLSPFVNSSLGIMDVHICSAHARPRSSADKRRSDAV